MEALYPLAIIVIYSSISFLLVHRLLPYSKSLFIKAAQRVGKKSDIPLGIVSCTVYLICMFLFIPVPIVTRKLWLEYNGRSSIFNYQELIKFLAGLLSVCCMVLLGFTNDILVLRKCYKIFLPALAVTPLLMVYYVNGGCTTITTPILMHWLLGKHLALGFSYYLYMCLLVVFCTNSINLDPGVHILEIGPSLVIGVSVLFFNVLELSYGCCSESHLFSIYFLLPFVFTSAALLYHNQGEKLFIAGEVFSFFSGMVFGVVAIFGHFGKTILFFFIPQMANFVYSLPQILGWLPQSNRRLPAHNENTDELSLSVFQFKKSDLKVLGYYIKMLHGLGLLHLNQEIRDGEIYFEMNNMTLTNFIIKIQGPIKKSKLVALVILIQIFSNCFGLALRYTCARVLYDNYES